MTAINALLLPAAVHIYADAGHYYADTLQFIRLEDKVFDLPASWGNIVIAFCGGVTGTGQSIHRKLTSACPSTRANVERMFVEATLASVNEVLIRRPYTSFLFGYDHEPFGMAVEETGKVHQFKIGNVIRTLTVPEQFDVDDLNASAVRMMQAQKDRYQIVHGHCRHTMISARGVQHEVVHRWPK